MIGLRIVIIVSGNILHIPSKGLAKPGNICNLWPFGASQVVLVVKNSPANAGDIRDMVSIPGLGRSLGGEHGNPLQLFLFGEFQGPRSLVV